MAGTDTRERTPRVSRPSVPLALVLVLLAFLLVAAWNEESTRRAGSESRSQELASLVQIRQSRAATLEEQLAELRAELTALEGNAVRTELRNLLRARERLTEAAGLAVLAGPGLVVELADSPLATRGDPQAADFQIQDIDLQLVVNELWRDGAEAIAVNDQRLVATSAIRSAGGAVLVNYEVMTGPYRVQAIGDPETLRSRFERSSIAEQFRGWVEVYRLGFQVRASDEITLPGYGGSVQFRHARPVDETDEEGAS